TPDTIHDYQLPIDPRHPFPPYILFPYTTLFRSTETAKLINNQKESLVSPEEMGFKTIHPQEIHGGRTVKEAADIFMKILKNEGRSEEHTTELQSRFEHVCRILLDKNKERNYILS